MRPVAGYRRSPYLFAAGSLGVVSHLALYGLPLALLDGSVLLVCLLMASNLSGAAADVVVDASIAEQTRQHPTLATNLQVLASGSYAAGLAQSLTPSLAACSSPLAPECFSVS